MLNKTKYFNLAEKECRKIFRSKKKMRTIWAKEPMERKIEEVIKLQEAMVKINPKVRKNNPLIPWKINP